LSDNIISGDPGQCDFGGCEGPQPLAGKQVAPLFALENAPNIQDFARLCGQTERDGIIDRGTPYGTPVGQA
jgi:hypothetical protein